MYLSLYVYTVYKWHILVEFILNLSYLEHTVSNTHCFLTQDLQFDFCSEIYVL